MRFCHHHLLQPSPALHWCKISPLFQIWPILVQNLKSQPILHNNDPQLSAIFRKEAQQPALKSSLPATTLQNSSCPSAFDSHQPNLNATMISAAQPSCWPSFFCSWLFAAGTLGKSDLSFCNSRKGHSMHCNVKKSQHSKQGDSRDVDESLCINTQSQFTYLLEA